MAKSVRRGGRLAIVGALPFALALSLGPPTWADPVPPPATDRLELDPPAPDSLYEDNPTHLSGRLESARPDKRIVIEAETSAGWHRVAVTRTDPNGAFRLTFKPANPGRLRLRALHRGGRRLVSAPQPLQVLDRRLFLVTETSYGTFDDIVLHGSVRPVGAGRRIVIQRLVGGRWAPLRGGFTHAGGRFDIRMPANLPGVWQVRAFWPGGHPADGTGEYSGVHRYTVVPKLDPVVAPVDREQLGGSYHEGCPVGPAALRNVTITYPTFGPTVGRGTLVVRETIVDRVIAVFGAALSHDYPVRRMFPTARYDGSDIASMYHDNTSAFNCRHVTGDPSRLSPHSYGTALDIDPVENPYLDVHGTWWPRTKGQEFRDRRQPRPGMLYAGSTVTRGLTDRGFRWGGGWSHPDYQHFDTGSGKADRRPPATRSGPLTARSMPSPAELGPGWRRFADLGGPEAGWVGSGSFVHARSGLSASRGVLPLGCRGGVSRQLPVPRFALQGSYRSTVGDSAQAVVLRFSDRPAAAQYFRGLVLALRHCRVADGPSGLAVRSLRVGWTSYEGIRHYRPDETWREHDRRRGSQVTVVLAAAG